MRDETGCSVKQLSCGFQLRRGTQRRYWSFRGGSLSAAWVPQRRRLTVIHLAAEYWPLARTGGLGEVVAGIARRQGTRGMPTLVLMPLYGAVRGAGLDLEPVGPPLSVRLGSRSEAARWWRVAAAPSAPQLVLLEHAEFFDRPGIYGDGGVDYADNARRFAFLSLAALRVLPVLAPGAAVLHAHDWHSALAPAYVRATLGGAYYDRLATVLTVHNAGFQGRFPLATLADLGLPLAPDGEVNFLRAGLAYADLVTTVSSTHALELRTALGGFGLHEVFLGLQDRLVGVLNGIDLDRWNPATDPAIVARYSAADLSGKAACKAALQTTWGLLERPDVAIVAMSARLVEQKGLDLVLASVPGLVEEAQFVFLGQGEPRYEAGLRGLAAAAPGRVAVLPEFNDVLEHRLLAGADMLLMPSLYEPCGLTQMRAQRYGTLPVVRRVGGLGETVVDGETGFVFNEYSEPALTTVLRRAIGEYRCVQWQPRMRAAMACDFGWDRAAERYDAAYARALRVRGSRRALAPEAERCESLTSSARRRASRGAWPQASLSK